jgi:chemotaxis protein methyltransferase CheR
MSSSAARIFSNEALDEIAKIISKITGNQFSSKHASMIEFRLKKRCLELKIDTVDNYYQYFRTHQETEVNYLVSLLTTHHTFFFREFAHFQFLEEKALPTLIPIIRKRADKKLRIWSAACSKGH